MNRILPAILLGTALLALPETASLQTTIPSPCSVLPMLPCNGGGSQSLVAIVLNIVFSGAARNTFGAFLALYFFIYAIRLILQGEKSDIVQETKMAYAYGITGSVIYIFADSIIASVGSQNGQTINTAPTIGALNSIIMYISAIMGALLLAIITYQAIRLIIKRGEEGEFELARKRLVYVATGIVVYVLANIIVTAALPGSGSTRFVREIVGLIRFLLQLTGAVAVLSFVFAGFLYVISVDEGLKDRAKRAMKNTVIALLVILFSYVIVYLTATGFGV